MELKDLTVDQKKEYVRLYNQVMWDAQSQKPYRSLFDRGLDVAFGLTVVNFVGRFIFSRLKNEDGDDKKGGGGGTRIDKENKDA